MLFGVERRTWYSAQQFYLLEVVTYLSGLGRGNRSEGDCRWCPLTTTGLHTCEVGLWWRTSASCFRIQVLFDVF